MMYNCAFLQYVIEFLKRRSNGFYCTVVICIAIIIIILLICNTIKEINERNNSHEESLHKQNVDDAKTYILLHEKCKYEKNCRKRK